jgi:hypothetical protein
MSQDKTICDVYGCIEQAIARAAVKAGEGQIIYLNLCGKCSPKFSEYKHNNTISNDMTPIKESIGDLAQKGMQQSLSKTIHNQLTKE